MSRLAPRALLSLSIALLAACASGPVAVDREPDQAAEADALLAGAGVPHVVIAEAFLTPMTPADNVDSPALSIGAGGKPLLLATAKAGGRLMTYDGDTGAPTGVVGRKGKAAGEFDRPNGIFAIDDLVFVVERDNQRVQVLRAPAMAALGSFGQADLRQPYGIWVRRTSPQRYDVLVSDAYMSGEDANGNDIVPPLAQLDRRLRRYTVDIGEGVQARLAGNIGDTGSAGAIRIPESVWGDPANDRLLVAEEDAAIGTAVRVYDMAGKYRGRDIGRGVFKAQAEGIALWQCDDGSGYWITTDQFKDRSLFHVWDRRSLVHVGAFAGKVVGNTDGVWLHQGPTPRFPQGVFYAVHDDMGVGAFDWRDIAAALKLPACGER
ncbi:MAG: phytase [Lysobacteraceae bacterium SCN 69-48]|nr:MAG: phytase [Xanthomonadaceae bacterium SCN 69-48]